MHMCMRIFICIRTHMYMHIDTHARTHAHQACIQMINESAVDFDGRRLKAERPPEPEEIFWDQLQDR